MQTETEQPVITKVEIGNLMGEPALILHFVGDVNQFPYEIGDSARQLVKKIWPDEEFEPHETPLGSQCCMEQPTEASLMVAIRMEDAIKFGATIENGELKLEY